MIILYINYVDDDLRSGSSVRPAQILRAFQETGHEIIVLKGEQFSKEREKSIKQVKDILKIRKPDICYIESPTYPIVRHSDRSLIRKIHRMGIPMAYFYRDFYRKFPEQFPRKRGFIGRLKDLGLDLLQSLTDRTLFNCDIVYFPSDEAAYLFNYKDRRSLPPAGVNKIIPNKKMTHTGIYVGGVIGPYNSTLLLDSFQKLHNEDSTYHLILVCREDEWKKVSHPCKNADWLELHHVSGKDLEPLYERASIAFVMPNSSFEYNQFAVSVKVFEYMSFGLPIVAVNCSALKRIVEKEDVGITINSNVGECCDAVKTILKDEQSFKQWCLKVENALIERNLWKHRVQQIIDDLKNIVKKK